ncbi:branched-chain amino acid transport system II carrier protein [Robiginitalea sp. IMCC43444]|uniref:branched-chain amino acid transport system II carrier protein n=1 Tax=Robiginitalea sp. IMCC43444 TaxID=3459121 RepID=UPI0040419773
MGKKSQFILALALFSLFFGAGNLILPPQLGYRAGNSWWLVVLGFCLSAVLIPMLGILAHARLQGGMFDFAKKVSSRFSLAYCFLVYGISIALPAPRTASVTHEMAIGPYLGSSPLWTSLLYFGLVFVFVLNRSRISSLIGKWLTPIILLVLLALIGNIVFDFGEGLEPGVLEAPFSEGILEGYQTFDAIGAVVVGGVILISLNLEAPELDARQRFRQISGAGWLAGAGLLILYTGLVLSGALIHADLDGTESRTEILRMLSDLALGRNGNLFLSILISLACFTTAVGIVTGTADFASSRFGNSGLAYKLTALMASLLGVIMGQLPVDYIILVALPALMFIYPLTIVLILLNVLPNSWTPAPVFRAVVFTTLLFSVPDFMATIGFDSLKESLGGSIPLMQYQLSWVLPAILVFAVFHLGSAKSGRVKP